MFTDKRMPVAGGMIERLFLIYYCSTAEGMLGIFFVIETDANVIDFV